MKLICLEVLNNLLSFRHVTETNWSGSEGYNMLYQIEKYQLSVLGYYKTIYVASEPIMRCEQQCTNLLFKS